MKKYYPDELNKQGIDFFKKKEFVKAITCFKKAIAINRRYVEAYVNLGITYSDAGLTDDAVKAFTKASVLDPLYVEKYGFDLSKREKTDEDVFYREARIACMKSEYGPALEYIENALKIKPDYPDFRNFAAEIFIKSGRLEKARFHLEKALELNPAYEKAKRNMAYILYLKGLDFLRDGITDKMLIVWRKALSLYPSIDYLRMVLNVEFTESKMQARCTNCEEYYFIDYKFCPHCGIEI